MDHLNKFNADQLTVRRFEYWTVVVRGKQVTFGATVVLPITPWEKFADVPSNAWAELQYILTELEKLAVERLNADKVNLVAAMMKDPFIHFHFFPRYGSTRTFIGREWGDASWPKVIEFTGSDAQEDVLLEIRSYLSELWRGADSA